METKQQAPAAGGNALNVLFRQSAHYGFGLAASMALGFISLPIYTRAFTIADYGLIDLATRVLLFATAASKLGLQNATLRFYEADAFAQNPDAARRFYSTMLNGVFATGVLVTLVFAAVFGFGPKSVFGGPLASILSLTSILILLRSLQSIFLAFLRIEEKSKAYNVVMVGVKAAGIAAVCLAFPFLGRSAHTYFIGIIVAEGLFTAGLSYRLFRRKLLSLTAFDPALFRIGITFGLPLVVQEVSSIFLDSGDKFLVRYYLGATPLGFYSLAYGLSSYVNTLLVTPLNLAIVPIYLRLWNSEGRAKTADFLSKGLDVFILAAAGIFAVVASSAHDAVLFLASSKYAGADRLIPTIVAGLLIYTMQVFLSAGLMIDKKTLAMAKVVVLAAIVKLALNGLLLPRIGLYGAALATLLSYAVCTLMLARVSFKSLPLRFEPKRLALYLFAAALSVVLAGLIDSPIRWINLLSKPAAAIGCYAIVIYVLDQRTRELVARFFSARARSAQCEEVL